MYLFSLFTTQASVSTHCSASNIKTVLLTLSCLPPCLHFTVYAIITPFDFYILYRLLLKIDSFPPRKNIKKQFTKELS